MPPLNWDAFVQLPGSAQYNFEMLCRALIRRHYSRYGGFAARANQPGVEFHLKLHTSCALGESGRWLGWQCRWYDLPGGRALSSARRKKITEAIGTTEKSKGEHSSWLALQILFGSMSHRPTTVAPASKRTARGKQIRFREVRARENDRRKFGTCSKLWSSSTYQ